MKQTKKQKSLASAVLSLALAASMTACANPSEPVTTTAPPAVTTVPETTEATRLTVPPTVPPTTQVPETTEPESYYDSSLDELRLRMEPSAAMLGVFYLGWQDGSILDPAFFDRLAEEGYLDDYPFITQIPLSNYALTEGNEVYLIVPADPLATVEVTEWDQAVGYPQAGELLYYSALGDPFFVQGNVSDIMSNISVNVVNSYGESITEFHPHISLRDGRLAEHQNPDDGLILDFTPYSGDVVLYYDFYFPDEDFESLTSLPMQMEYPDAEELLYTLSLYDVVPPHVYLNSFDFIGPTLYLDFNGAFTDYINSLGMHGEELILASIVNTYLSCFEAEDVYITVDGGILETVHNYYPDSFGYLYPQD